MPGAFWIAESGVKGFFRGVTPRVGLGVWRVGTACHAIFYFTKRSLTIASLHADCLPRLVERLHQGLHGPCRRPPAQRRLNLDSPCPSHFLSLTPFILVLGPPFAAMCLLCTRAVSLVNIMPWFCLSDWRGL